jgi:hypothetical protein
VTSSGSARGGAAGEAGMADAAKCWGLLGIQSIVYAVQGRDKHVQGVAK